MRAYDLFKELAESRTEEVRFSLWTVKSTESAREETMKKAQMLKEDDYVMYTKCYNDGITIFLEGIFTSKGNKFIMENKIERVCR